ncbi:hypothetical protein [Achromobacter piechaudii]|uniref:Uncharacterized protein n=1 Tax=Achromobacter piechaudii TaxID=72556 RepID=A0ABN7F4W5_9BURK|nr:hypothetical protein [Achromobacter piechaudii]CAB3729175.1 hypothetical protein LMG1873_04650 [Achromobacter piechaudii]
MNHNQIGQFTASLQQPKASSLGNVQRDEGEIFAAVDALNVAISKCEFITQELVGRLEPVLASVKPQAVAGGIAPDPQPDTQLARIVQEHTHRVRSLTLSIENAAKRLALP